MSTTGNPFGAAQAMAAFNQRNASNPFGMSNTRQGLTKEQANQQSAQTFSAAVQAANPHLDFSKRNLNNMTGMVDPYQQAEEYYRRYGTGMPQTPGGSVGVDPATGQIRFDSPVGASIASQQIGDGGRSTEKPSVFPGTESKGVNTAASQLAAMSRPQTTTGSPFGETNTRESLYQQPMQQSQTAAFPGLLLQSSQQSPYSNISGSPQLQSAINSRYGGNQNVIPLEGRFGLVRLAGGGEVSEARRMLQNLQNPVQRFADGNEVKKTNVDQAAQDFIKATGAVNPAQTQSRAELDAMITANAPARERALADPLMAYNSEFQTQFLPRALEAGLTAQQALEKFAQDKTAAFGTSVRYPSNNTVMPQLQGFINAVNSGNAGDATKFASRAGMLGVNYNDFLDMAESASPGVGSTMYEKFYDPNSEFRKQGKTFWPDLANLFQGGSPNPWSVIKDIKPKTGLTDEQIGYALGITGDDVKDAFQGKLVTLPPFGAAQAGGTQAGGTQAGGTQAGGTQAGGTQAGGTQAGAAQAGAAQVGGTQAGSTTSAVTILPPTTALPELTSKFTPEVAPPPEAPPPALTPGQEGLDPSTAIVGAIPQSERVTIPQPDTQFRASAPRTPTYDRFGRITGYNYSPAAKLTSATGTNVFNFVPPGITSRPRSLLDIGDVPGVTIDPVTGQMRLPLSASQQFARDRSELDTAIRELYRRKSETDSSVPSTIPAPAAEAFRQLAMTDPSLSKQIRYRDISQDVYDPTKADASLRAQFGRPQAEAALTKAFDPFFERNRAALTSLAKDITAPKGYSEMYPDIAAAYDKLSAAEKAKFPTLQDYERYHFDTYGKNEGRVSPLELMAKANPLRGPYTTSFFSKGGEASTEDFIKKQSGGDVSRETASPNTAEVPQLDTEGQLIDEREEIRSESQRMLNRLQSQPSKLPPGLRRTVAATREQGKESMFPTAAPARDLLSGILGASPTAPGSEAYRTGQAIANMPPVQAAAAIPAKIAASAGDAATALAAMGPAVGAVMKPKGGNWLAPSVERGLNYLIPRTGAGNRTAKETLEEMNRTYPAEELARMSPETRASVDRAYQWLEPNVAIQNWIEKKLTKYVKNEMATPEDPVRALAERGILHVDPEQLNSYPGAGNPTNQAVARRALSYPEEGLARSEAARKWETASDYMIQTDRALNLLNPKEYGQGFVDQTLAANPWLTKIDPYERIYGVDTLNYRPDYSELGFDHLIDELKNSLNPNSGLPRELQLDPKKLDKVSVPQAVELVDKINKWRVENAGKLRLEETLKADLYKAYPEQKYRWVQLNRPGQFAAESDAMGHSVRGYEPPDRGGSDYYGVGGYNAIESGEAKIYSLRDEKGQPHVTIEVETNRQPYAVSGQEFAMLDPQTKAQYRQYVMEWRRRNPEVEELTDDDVMQALREAGVPPIGDRILQIKGKGNAMPAEKYLPFVQDFVKSGNWSEVNDLRNAGLTRVGNKYLTSEEVKPLVEQSMRYLEQSPALEPYRQAERALNDYWKTGSSVHSSRYRELENQAGMQVHPDIPYTYGEMRSIFQDPGAFGENSLSENLERVNRLRQLYGEEGFKKGGPVDVPRETSTSKQQLDKLAQVSKRKKA